MAKGGKVQPSKAFVKVQHTLTRAQVVALRSAALDRQAKGEPGRADASAVLRELLDEWMKRRK